MEDLRKHEHLKKKIVLLNLGARNKLSSGEIDHFPHISSIVFPITKAKS